MQPIISDKAIVYEVKSSYTLLLNNNHLIRYQGKTPLVYGDQITFDTDDLKPVNGKHSLFSFDSANYYREKRIFYSLDNDNINIIHRPGLRGYIHQRISSYKNDRIRTLLLKLIFNISSDNAFLDSFGLNNYGIALFLEYLIRKKSERYKRYVSGILIILLIILPSFSLFRYLIFYLFSSSSFNRSDSLGASGLLIIALFPYKALSTSFLIPFIIRFISLF